MKSMRMACQAIAEAPHMCNMLILSLQCTVKSKNDFRTDQLTV